MKLINTCIKIDKTNSWHLPVWLDWKHGEVNFYLTQFLSGHVAFGSYLYKFDLRDSDECLYCGEDEPPEHFFLFIASNLIVQGTASSNS